MSSAGSQFLATKCIEFSAPDYTNLDSGKLKRGYTTIGSTRAPTEMAIYDKTAGPESTAHLKTRGFTS